MRYARLRTDPTNRWQLASAAFIATAAAILWAIERFHARGRLRLLLIPALGIPLAFGAGRWYDSAVRRARKSGIPGRVERVRWVAVGLSVPPVLVLALLSRCQPGAPPSQKQTAPATREPVERGNP